MTCTFADWCEVARRASAGSGSADQLAALDLPGAATEVEVLLRLHRAALGHPGVLEGLRPDGTALTGAEQVAIIAGAAGSMSAAAADDLASLLQRALSGYRGVLLCGGSGVGVPGVVGAVARDLGLRLVGYSPLGRADRRLYPEVRETPGEREFSVREPLVMWTDILRAGIDAHEVSLLAIPGGSITVAEIVLARSLGARVAWLDPAGEATGWLDEVVPGGAADVLELPADAMTIHAFITSSRLPDELRELIAEHFHEAYRRRQRQRKPAGDPALAPWSQLDSALKASNRAQADGIPDKLAMVGKQLARPGDQLTLTAAQIELLAEVEHGRWNFERLSAGWVSGARQIVRCSTPTLRPWTELEEAEREYDREAVRDIPPALAAAGWGVAEAC